MLPAVTKNSNIDRPRLSFKAASLIAIALAFTSEPVLAGDFELGLDAFRAGDMQTAIDEWQPLAEAGDPDAQHALGMMYEYGRGFERDDAAAANWYEKAAKQSMTEAQYRLGVLHDNGWGVPRDPSLAAKWYERAAQSGHAFAQHDLAYMHLNGTGVPKDKVLAYKWLRIASEQQAGLMAKHLHNVSKTMTSAELARAEALAQAWLNSDEI